MTVGKKLELPFLMLNRTNEFGSFNTRYMHIIHRFHFNEAKTSFELSSETEK